MRIEYDPNLVEQAVFLLARRDPNLEHELHAATDPLYAMPNGREREAKFRQIYATFFSRFMLDSVLSTLLAERPLIAKCVGKYVVREAPREKAESAELFVKESKGPAKPLDRTLIIQVSPHSLLDPESLATRMRRELLHVSDMLDDEFQYDPESLDGFSARQNLIRDRYRVLWDIYVEGRLVREGKIDEPFTGRLSQMFTRAFTRPGRVPTGEPLDKLLAAEKITHRQLLRWAADPDTLFGCRHSAASPRRAHPGPGEPCPLCGFPTHDWYEFEGNEKDDVVAAVCASRPDWKPDQGACRQCAETYHLSTKGTFASRGQMATEYEACLGETGPLVADRQGSGD